MGFDYNGNKNLRFPYQEQQTILREDIVKLVKKTYLGSLKALSIMTRGEFVSI